MSTEKLFGEFPAVGTAEWEAVISADLKGADYEKRLVTKTPEGLAIRPYYRDEALQGLDWLLAQLPGEYPFVRGYHRTDNSWENRQEILDSDPTRANTVARRAVGRGADAIAFSSKAVAGKIQGTNLQSQQSFAVLLDGIDLSKTAIHLDFGSRAAQALALLANHAEKGVGLSKVKGSIQFDPWAELALQGSSANDAEGLAAVVTDAAKFAKTNLPGVRPITIQGHAWHNAGATLVQETACALAAGADAMTILVDAGISAADAARLVGFSFSIGSNYFLQIARLRAFRVLWAQILAGFGVAQEECRAYVHARTSWWSKTIYDPNVNLLRATTEAMSAVMGGVDALSVMPYDSVFRTPDEFSYRIARNTGLVLASEAGLNRWVDPTAGSYYVESITDQLAAAILAQFQQIESKGGLLAALQDGALQSEIAKVQASREKGVANRRDSILGTNAYPNTLEKMSGKIETPVTSEPCCPEILKECCDVVYFRDFFLGKASSGSCCSGKAATPALVVKPLVVKRAAEAFEALRKATEAYTEKNGSAPKVFLWTAGNLAMRLARATFVKNFYGCAGFDVIDNNGFKSAEDGIAAALKHNPQIVVLCSSDDEYPVLAPDFCKVLQDKLPKAERVVAGYPEAHLEALKAAGIQEFVHVRTVAAEYLNACQARLGVK